MAQEWREVISSRQERSKLHHSFVDGAATDSYACDAVVGRLHYPSVLDGSIQDTEIDCTPVRVDTPQFDGWRVSKNDWHYALGKDLANHGNEDGWVGFGGRQGQHWFKFRLLRLGYLHWPTRAWQDIGGAPDYDRANLSQTVGNIEFPVVGASIPAASMDTWERIWSTAGGGQLDVSWGKDGYHLKEEIRINQAGRAWIATNRPPSTPPAETWFGFVIELDWSDIPRIYRAGVLKQADDDYADDGEDIVLRDAMDRLLAYMPISEAYVETALGQRETVALRKRFYTDASRHYLLVGARVPDLSAMPAGDLVFDPTVDVQVGAGADDTTVDDLGRYFPAQGTVDVGRIFYLPDVAFRTYESSLRWTGVTIAGTIAVSYTETFRDGGLNNPATKWKGEDADNPGAIVGWVDFYARIRTTAEVDDDFPGGVAGWHQSPSLNTIFQELVNTYDITADAVQLFWEDDGSGDDNYFRAESFEGSAPNAARLHVEWALPGGGGDPSHGAVGPGAGGQLGGVRSTDHGPVGPGGILWP